MNPRNTYSKASVRNSVVRILNLIEAEREAEKRKYFSHKRLFGPFGRELTVDEAFIMDMRHGLSSKALQILSTYAKQEKISKRLLWKIDNCLEDFIYMEDEEISMAFED